MTTFTVSTYTITEANFEDAGKQADGIIHAFMPELPQKLATRRDIIQTLSQGNRVFAVAGSFRAELKLQAESGFAGPYLEAWIGRETVANLPLPKISSAL